MATKSNAAPIDVDFLTGQHHSLAGLTEIDHLRYLKLWGLGLKYGRELLPEAYNLTHQDSIKRAVCIRRTRRSMSDSCINMTRNGLIVLPLLHHCCRIVVVGLDDRYPKRGIEKWDGSICKDIVLDRSGLDRSTRKTSASPPPADVDNSAKTSNKTDTVKKGNRSPRQLDMDKLNDAVLTVWREHFGPDTAIGKQGTPGVAGMLQKVGRSADRWPTDIIRVIPKDVDNPFGWLKDAFRRGTPSKLEATRKFDTWITSVLGTNKRTRRAAVPMLQILQDMTVDAPEGTD